MTDWSRVAVHRNYILSGYPVCIAGSERADSYGLPDPLFMLYQYSRVLLFGGHSIESNNFTGTIDLPVSVVEFVDGTQSECIATERYCFVSHRWYNPSLALQLNKVNEKRRSATHVMHACCVLCGGSVSTC